MFIQSFYRNVVFPGFETVYKRRKTIKYWRDLERSQWFEPKRLAGLQFAAFRDLLQHAQQNCAYYRNAWAELGIDVKQIQTPADLRKLPLLTKDDIRTNGEAMRAMNVPGKLITKTTGGSTGVPLRFHLDQRSHERRCAATFRGYSWCGAGPGTKQVLSLGVPLQERPKWQEWKDRVYDVLQRRTMVNSFALDDQAIPDVQRRLEKYRPDVIVAYTNAVYHFARSLQERNLKPFSPKSIVVGAEKLHDFQRETIESVFDAPVYETYGSREFMLIGAECSHKQGLHLTSEQLYVEILNDDGTPTPDGEVGNVVVSDLYNYGMPFVRYVTGDEAVAGFRTCSCGRSLPLLRQVRGRRLDVLRSPDGRSTPGEFFPHLVKDYEGVRRFQVIQHEPSRVEVLAVLSPRWSQADEVDLLGRIRQQMGPTVSVEWSPRPKIELTRFGKHQVVVNRCADAASAV